MRLTEAKDITLLSYFAEQNAKNVLPPSPNRSAQRTLKLLRLGLLKISGLSAMWGNLYFITPEGRAALTQSVEKK